MMHKGHATVTDWTTAPATGLCVLDLWHGAAHVAGGIDLPAPGRALAHGEGHVLRVGPRRWWLDGADLGALDPAHGALTAIGGGWTRVRVTGPDWRAMLMEGALFDAEDPTFVPGSVATGLFAHAHVVVHVRDAAVIDLFVPATLADHVLGLWRAHP